MSVLIDTSAFYALLDSQDLSHDQADREWRDLLSYSGALVTSSYVVLETCALLQNRIGLDAVRCFHEEILPSVRIGWVDALTYGVGMTVLLAIGRRGLSLVDCVSFVVMERLGIKDVFTFDAHFKDRGFECRP